MVEVYRRKYIHGLLLHAKHAQCGMWWRNILDHTFIFCTYTVWCQLTHFTWILKTPLAYYRQNASKLKVFMTHKPPCCDNLWDDCINVMPLPYGKEFTRRTTNRNTIGYYQRSISYWQGIYTFCHFSCSYLSKRLIRRELIQIYVFISPYKWRRKKREFNTL